MGVSVTCTVRVQRSVEEDDGNIEGTHPSVDFRLVFIRPGSRTFSRGAPDESRPVQ